MIINLSVYFLLRILLDSSWHLNEHPGLGELERWLRPLLQLVDSVGGDGEEESDLGKVVERESGQDGEVEEGDDGVEDPVEEDVVGGFLLLAEDLEGLFDGPEDADEVREEGKEVAEEHVDCEHQNSD